MWYTSKQDGGIEYKAEGEVGSMVTIDRVLFQRFNVEAGVRETVSIHWTEAFKWADFDPCGGLGISGVKLSDGRECFASGRWFANDDGGLAAVHVGCYGDAWMTRSCKVKRDKHGFAIVQQAA